MVCSLSTLRPQKDDSMSSLRQVCLTLTLVFTLVVGIQGTAQAGAQGVGLGVAAGAVSSGTELDGLEKSIGTGFSWGFFVDIPLTPTFYISPATTLYEIDLGIGKRPATDVALNFKFIVPIAAIKLGAGVSAGLTVAEEKYMPHMGALGYLSMNIASNLDGFAMVQYKHLVRDIQAVDDIHAHAGLMFRF